MKKKLLLDVDGVLASFYNGFAIFLNKEYKVNLDLTKEPRHYNFNKWNEKCSTINLDEAAHNWILQSGFRKAPMYNGANLFVENLNEIANVYVVTARIGDFQQKFGAEVINKIKDDTMEWFKENKIPVADIFFEHKKIEFCKANNIPVLIEDKLDTVLSATKENINSVLINRGWNQHPKTNNIHRVNSYNDAIEIVRKINNE